MDVFLCADGAYAMPLAVTLKSIERSQPELEGLRVSVLSVDLNPEAEARIRRSVPDLDVRFLDVTPSLPPNLPEMRWFTQAAYGRLLGPSVLANVERAIYLDTDLLVLADLTELYAMDLAEHVVGAVRSPKVPTVSSPLGIVDWAAIGLDPVTPYFNSGVLLIDMQRWRDTETTARVFDFVRAHGDRISLADQDGLNAVLAGQFARLPLRWNQETSLREPMHLGYLVGAPEEVELAVEDPAIVHFTGESKPWHPGCTDLSRDRWWSALRDTDYAGYAFPRRTVRQRVADGIYRRLFMEAETNE